MSSWISDFFEARTSPADLGGLDKSAAEQLVTALAELDQISPGLGSRAASFVLSGQDAEVLDSLAATVGGGSVLRLLIVRAKSLGPFWSQWFAQAKPAAAVAWRLGQVFEAASRAERWLPLDMQALGLTAWVEILLQEILTFVNPSVRPNTSSSADQVYPDHALWEEMLVLDGQARDVVVKATLSVPHLLDRSGCMLASIPGLDAAVARHAELIRTMLNSCDVKDQVVLVNALRSQGCHPEPFATQIATMLISESKTTRETAEAWAVTGLAAVLEAMRKHASAGTPTQRSRAIGFIAQRMPDGVAEFLDERLAHEDNANVKKVIAGLQAQVRATTAPQARAKPLPPVQDAGIRPLSEIGKAAIATLAETWYQHELAWCLAEERRILALRHSGNPFRRGRIPTKPVAFAPSDMQRLVALLENPAVTLAEVRSWERNLVCSDQTWDALRPVIQSLLTDPQVSPELVLRLAALLSPDRTGENNRRTFAWVVNCLYEYRKATRTVSGTRTFLSAADRLGLPSTDLAWELIDSYQGIRWPLNDLWEWYYEHPEVIFGALGPGEANAFHRTYLEPYRYANVLALVEQFPDIPVSLQPLLWDLAIGGNGSKRGPAQRAVSRFPGMLSRVLSALSDGKQEVRLHAAAWLAELRDPAAITPLEQAMQREKSEPVQAAMMAALEKFGISIDRFLDRPGLAKAAAKGLAKGIPKDLAWLPLAALPTPGWKDGSGSLPREVLTWWIVQACKRKDPAPTPLLRRYAAMLASEAAHALGERILLAWIAEDTRPPTPTEVAEYIKTHGGLIMAEAQRMASHSQFYAQALAAPGAQPTANQWYDRLVELYRRTSPPGRMIAYRSLFASVAAMLANGAADDLGKRIIAAWNSQDIQPPTLDEMVEQLKTFSSSMMGAYQIALTISQSQMGVKTKPVPQLTAQQWYDRSIEEYRSTPVGTMIAAKGMLAVAAAMGGPRLAPLVSQYLKRWYGLRAAQCKALLHMLAATEHPTAIQVLLATSTRFRTAGIRKEAEACVQEIAKRHDWSVDELADRTIPLAGFDEEGELVLSYGERSFAVRLQPDLDVVIQDGQGKTLAALPAPRADEDAAAVEAAKKALSEAKKQIKTIVKQQAERLYEAMCTSRRWQAADWRTYLFAHPVVGRLCRQVVWAWSTPSAAQSGTFRALEDGTLTDVADSVVAVPDDAWVSVAHPITVGVAIGARWKQHLADYEVSPLFSQFDRAPLALPESLALEQEIVDRTGYLIEAFKLRGRATKLGWTRGQADDGGVFDVYRKHFTTAGITAVLEFTGNSLPEENRVTALRGLSFERSGPDGSSESTMLSEVPAPLLSECWNDVHDIAAQGTGFDPKWENYFFL